MKRLKEVFDLALKDIMEADAALQIVHAFDNIDQTLESEPDDIRMVWDFMEQGVLWKLALAVQRLSQHASTDRASLKGIVREIDRVRRTGYVFPDQLLIERAKIRLDDALAQDICTSLRSARHSFMAHTLASADRKGTRVYDLIDLLGILNGVMDDLHIGVFGRYPDNDEHITTWMEYCFAWTHRYFPQEADDTNSDTSTLPEST